MNNTPKVINDDNQITIRMKKAHLKAWLRDLRSGNYKQGAGWMTNASGRYCCLGVMACAIEGKRLDSSEMAVKAGSILPSPKYLKNHGIFFTDERGNTQQQVPFLPTLGVNAYYANDIRCKTFAEIADAIEACAVGY